MDLEPAAGLPTIQGGALPVSEWSAGVSADDLRLELETDLERDLEVGERAVLDMAASFHDFKPVQAPQGRAGAGDSAADGVVGALGRGADDLDDAVGVAAHWIPSPGASVDQRPALGVETARCVGRPSRCSCVHPGPTQSELTGHVRRTRAEGPATLTEGRIRAVGGPRSRYVTHVRIYLRPTRRYNVAAVDHDVGFSPPTVGRFSRAIRVGPAGPEPFFRLVDSKEVGVEEFATLGELVKAVDVPRRRCLRGVDPTGAANAPPWLRTGRCGVR